MQFSVVGPGRAGGAFTEALTARGWTLVASYGRNDDVRLAATGPDVVLLTVPDRVIATVASLIEPGAAAIVHVAGSQTLDVLEPHHRTGSVHPLMTLPDAAQGAQRLLDHCAFAVAGDPVTRSIVDALNGQAFDVADTDRLLYHGIAAIASNHLTALVGQVQRLAGQLGIPSNAYRQIMEVSLHNATELGAQNAITGPASRGDWDTVRGHLSSLSEEDRRLYLILANEAAQLAGQEPPEDIISA